MSGSNSGSTLAICATAQPTALADAAAYAALTWVQVKHVGNIDETGILQNILNYDTWDDAQAIKAKGMVDGGSPNVELSADAADAGQDALRTAAAPTNPLAYAFRITRNNKATDGGTGRIEYFRALATGPRRPNGRNEDFDLEVFTLGVVQKEIVVDPT